MSRQKFYFSYQSCGWILEGYPFVFPTKQDLIDFWKEMQELAQDDTHPRM